MAALRERLIRTGIEQAERGRVPDAVLRRAIRRMLADRLRALRDGGPDARRIRREALLSAMDRAPVALAPEAANAQHYEVPADFFETVLGPRLKYSACLFEEPATEPTAANLAAAEDAMLTLTCERAGLEDGMRLLDLGCGWGSLSLYVAERFPRCTVLAVSNSKAQAEHIRRRADRLGTERLRVATADMNAFDPGERFDRVISVEMFEHMRNWRELLRRIAGWLEPDGRLLAHFFCHRTEPYPYEDAGAGDWMARHFFSGGMMPSEDLILGFAEDLVLEERWRVDGLHYHRTCEAWLANLDARRDVVAGILGRGTSAEEARRRTQRWRLFFLACSELFRHRGGREWFVQHARLAPRGPR